MLIIPLLTSRDSLVVRTLRCGRNNPGSNPGHGIKFLHTCFEFIVFFLLLFIDFYFIIFLNSIFQVSDLEQFCATNWIFPAGV